MESFAGLLIIEVIGGTQEYQKEIVCKCLDCIYSLYSNQYTPERDISERKLNLDLIYGHIRR